MSSLVGEHRRNCSITFITRGIPQAVVEAALQVAEAAAQEAAAA